MAIEKQRKALLSQQLPAACRASTRQNSKAKGQKAMANELDIMLELSSKRMTHRRTKTPVSDSSLLLHVKIKA